MVGLSNVLLILASLADITTAGLFDDLFKPAGPRNNSAIGGALAHFGKGIFSGLLRGGARTAAGGGVDPGLQSVLSSFDKEFGGKTGTASADTEEGAGSAQTAAGPSTLQREQDSSEEKGKQVPKPGTRAPSESTTTKPVNPASTGTSEGAGVTPAAKPQSGINEGAPEPATQTVPGASGSAGDARNDLARNMGAAAGAVLASSIFSVISDAIKRSREKKLKKAQEQQQQGPRRERRSLVNEFGLIGSKGTGKGSNNVQGFIPGLLPGPALKPPGGLLGPPGGPLLGDLLSGLGNKFPRGQLNMGPQGISGAGLIPGVLQASGSIGTPGSPAAPNLLSLLSGMPGGGLGVGGPGHLPNAPGPTGKAESTPAPTGSSGSRKTEDSSEEDDNKKTTSRKKVASSSSESTTPKTPSSKAGGRGSGKSRNEADSSEENHTNKRKDSGEDRPRSGGGRRGKTSKRRGGSRSNGKSSEETTTRRTKNSNEEDSDSSEATRGKKKSRRGKRRDKRSVMDEFGLMGIKGMHHAADNVPDHVKLVYCGRNEVPNPGGIEDHFCHPEATWETLLRMRPDCVCQQGYLRNSWGECISPAECDHCSDKHHLNMDYHLCESPCPIVCNQPIDENCANMCFKECACRPGYIRAYPNGPCVSIKQCLPGCRGRNQIFSLCSSLCPPTCRKPVPKRCPKICAGEGCVCKPGYVVKRWEPLECVRPEDCPGRRRKCPGPNQRYTRCIRRCVPSCFNRRHRYCGHECLGRGCVCKRGYVALQRRPLVCVPRDQCPKSRKKCPARNQVYMYCKSKCPRTCDNPKPRRCGWACDGEGCACKPGYVMKQEDPLICVRRYQCSSEFDGLEMLKGAKGGMGGAKGGMGGAKGEMRAEEAKGGMGAKGGIGEKRVTGAEEAKKVMGAERAEGAKGVEGTKRRRRKKGSSKRRKPSWEFSPQ
ncbi:uncharacterized protein LOC144150932 isoform X2 [Haemaphysalis longicornis]